jgi:uncharacterized protein YggT (Ycf19 family)
MRATAIALGPTFYVIFRVLDVIQWLVFAWVILSWIAFFASQSSFRWRHRGPYNILMQLNDILSRMAWPFLKPFRRLMRRWDTAGIDWSPMLLWLFILLLRALLQGLYGLIMPSATP